MVSVEEVPKEMMVTKAKLPVAMEKSHTVFFTSTRAVSVFHLVQIVL